MKAGIAGSNPDGATIKPTPTDALGAMLRQVGSAVFHLNTCIVGLDAVAQGYEKPATLDISWQPNDRVIAAKQARRFVLHATLITVTEAMAQYIGAVCKLPRVPSTTDLPAAQRLETVATMFVASDDYLVPAVKLAIHWRNRAVHSKSVAKLEFNEEKLLQSCAAEIASKFAGLDVQRLLRDFESNSASLKDITTLVAMTIRLARKIDRALYQTLGESDIRAWIDHFGLTAVLEKVNRETSPQKRSESIRRAFLSRAPRLFEVYQRLGLDK